MNKLVRQYLGGRVRVFVGDITQHKATAIVNAANSTLLGGGGVDGAIHRAGGPIILDQCKELRKTIYKTGMPVGAACVTTAGRLPADFVMHTVGPVYDQYTPDEADSLLASCYSACLSLASQLRYESVAFPAISTGAFGFPSDRAAAIASKTIELVLICQHHVKTVDLVFFSESDAATFIACQAFSAAPDTLPATD